MLLHGTQEGAAHSQQLYRGGDTLLKSMYWQASSASRAGPKGLCCFSHVHAVTGCSTACLLLLIVRRFVGAAGNWRAAASKQGDWEGQPERGARQCRFAQWTPLCW